MDVKMIRNLALNKSWKGPRSGDEYNAYRNSLLKVLHYLDDLSNEDGWNSFGLDELSDDELAEIAFSYVRNQRNLVAEVGSKFNRQLLSNELKGIGNKNYSVFEVREEDNLSANRRLIEIDPAFKDIISRDESKGAYQDIDECVSRVTSLMLDCHGKSRQECLQEIIEYNKYIYDRYITLPKIIGVSIIDVGLIKRYMKFAEQVCYTTIIEFILNNKEISDKKMVLKRLIHYIEKLADESNYEDIDNKERSHNSIDILSSILILFFDMRNQLMFDISCQNLLTNEINNYPECFEPPMEGSCYCSDDSDDGAIKRYILENGRTNEYKRKLDDIKKLLSYARLNNNNKVMETGDVSTVKIAFRAVFLSKVKFERRKPMTIVRDLLNSNEHIDKEDLRAYYRILDLIMEREWFRESKIIDFYDDFNRVCEKYRGMLLALLRPKNFYDIFVLIYECIADYLEFFIYDNVPGCIGTALE